MCECHIFKVILLVCLTLKGTTSGFYNCTNSKNDRPTLTYSQYGCFIDNKLKNVKISSLYEVDKDIYVSALKQSFCCFYSKPIEWIIDTDLTNLVCKRNYFEKQRVKNSTFYDFKYSSEFLFVYELKDIRDPFNVTCQPVNENNPCKRQTIQVERGPYVANFANLPLPSFIFDSSSEEKNGAKLDNSSLQLDTGKITNKKNCQFNLFVKQIKGNIIQYKWEDDLGQTPKIQKAIVSNNSVYFENIFRGVEQNKNCVQVLEPQELCINCRTVSQYVANSIVFYARNESFEMVLKGLFSISKSFKGIRTFYMEWDVPRLEMIHLQEIPDILYTHQTYLVGCNVSIFYFSYGVNLTSQLNMFNESEMTHEICRENGNIEASKNFTFQKGQKNETITCFAPLLKFPYWISKSKTVFIEDSEQPEINGSEWEIYKVNENQENVTIICEVGGKPLPNLKWILPIESLATRLNITISTEDLIVKGEIFFPIFTQEFQGIYKCLASNINGTAAKSFEMRLPPVQVISATDRLKSWILSILAVLTVIFLGVLFLLWREVKIQKVKYQKDTERVKKEFLDGVRDSQSEGFCPLQLPILSRPYNKEFEVPYEKWVIDDETLGAGEFGLVKKGTVETDSKVHRVAVKMLKATATLEDFKGFLLEIKVMEYVGHHPNVISLVACCTQRFDQRDVLIGVEFCPNGSLRTYILERKNIYQKREDRNSQADALNGKGHYGNLVHSSLTEVDLYTWAFQIAQGMEFLANKNVLHGDLAARNILLKADKVAKISDFGLARFLNEHGSYVKRSIRVPWKLMPPEALKSLQFSTASDIWAYGVLLWELFSLGEIPYAGIPYNVDFLKNLENGLRPTKPSRAPDNVYGIMTKCWDPEPEKRPSFIQLKSAFSKVLESISKNQSYRISKEIFAFPPPYDPVKIRGRAKLPEIRQESEIISIDDDRFALSKTRKLNTYSNISNTNHGTEESTYYHNILND